jgi:hypothetical protein
VFERQLSKNPEPQRGDRDAHQAHRGTSFVRNNPSLGPYSRLMPRALCWS